MSIASFVYKTVWLGVNTRGQLMKKKLLLALHLRIRLLQEAS